MNPGDEMNPEDGVKGPFFPGFIFSVEKPGRVA